MVVQCIDGHVIYACQARMELRHLRYFVAVADTGGFSPAAARLRITQPALCRQVHGLEAELGVRLFTRAGRGVRLTREGESLLRRSRELLSSVEQFGGHADALRGGTVGSLRIGASPQAIQSLLAPFLARYLESRPGIEVHLIEEGGARLPSLVERGEVDIGLAVLLRGGERLSRRLLAPVRLLAALPSTHSLRRQSTVDVRQLHGEPVLLLRHGFGTREMFDAACRLAHVRPHLALESGDPQSLIALAEAGRGVAVVPSTVRFMHRKVRVKPILHNGASLGTWGWVVWDPRRALPACAPGFVDALLAHTARHYPGREFDRRAPSVPRPAE